MLKDYIVFVMNVKIEKSGYKTCCSKNVKTYRNNSRGERTQEIHWSIYAAAEKKGG